MIFVRKKISFDFLLILSIKVGSKPDRSFVTPFYQPHANDQVFAEVESIREGCKSVVFTYVCFFALSSIIHFLFTFSYKDCPSFDLDKLLEDVQNGLYPITAYHLLFPTHSTLSLLTKSSISDKLLTTSSSLSSFPSSTVTNTDNDIISSTQSNTDSLVFYPINSNDSNSTGIITNGVRSRNGTTTYERSNSVINDFEHNGIDSISTTTHTNSSTVPLSNSEEKENRRIIDIQCKVKTKETGSSLVGFLFE